MSFQPAGFFHSALQAVTAARSAYLGSQGVGDKERNSLLFEYKRALEERREEVLEANRTDLENAKAALSNGSMSKSNFDRLDIAGSGNSKYATMLQGMSSVQSLPSPIGVRSYAMKLDDGLELFREACPIGVICVIFESRPDVIVQISSLIIKSGNAVILKGGKEAQTTNEKLISILRDVMTRQLKTIGLDPNLIQLLSSREEIKVLLDLDRQVDLIIPRGSKELVHYIRSNTKIPVISHADGICAIYIDAAAVVDKAVRIVVDAKTNYPAACNAVETVLVHCEVCASVLPPLINALLNSSVHIRADERVRECLSNDLQSCVSQASSADFSTEFSDLVVVVAVVDSLQHAISHINTYGSHHTDVIVTEDRVAADQFLGGVDSASVFVNASTRFADGFRYGFGAEVGISTEKTHARGPVGMEGLMIYKYKLYGDGHCVGSYGPGKRAFLHQRL